MPTQVSSQAALATPEQAQQQAVDLLSQQIWCWGQDVMRPVGNWLIECGFDRLAAPADREQCSSVYTLELPERRRVVLRGFGVFYGDDQLGGGVFLQRFEFLPLVTEHADLKCPPWSTLDLPDMSKPTAAQREKTLALTLDLIDWIGSYEANVEQRLGIEYRKATLANWSNKHPIVPAGEMSDAWRALHQTVANNAAAFIRVA